MPQDELQDGSSAYLVGGGIASMAAAAFLIRDGRMKGHDITIVEESERIGGSLDAAGTPANGYVMRGGRMLESKYLCTFDLFSSIPTLDNRTTVTEETIAWNEIMKTSSRSRLFRGGKSVDAPGFGLLETHILAIERLEVEAESALGRTSIADQFEPSFFKTDFWFMWCTTFAFQPWHSAVEFKRYLVRFTHMVRGFNTLSGIMRTVYNQYDSMVLPLRRWLEERGVEFKLDTCVTDLDLMHDSEGYSVERIQCKTLGRPTEIRVKTTDLVFVTLGSMTEGSDYSSMDSAPILNGKTEGGAWTLWANLARRQADAGHPQNFVESIQESKWVSFTTTLHDPLFFDLVRDLTGNAAGEGGLITFPESSWLLSIVLPHQPHFLGQPEDVTVFWGYGLAVDAPGDFVKKPMSACTGREIMTEVMGHLHLASDTGTVLASCVCIPCMMPFITSQFLRRSAGDRPDVIPERSRNLAYLGQYCEMPDDVVFTVEYSVRSAQTAVYKLLGLDRKAPPVFKGNHDLQTLRAALRTLHSKSTPPPAIF